ncbi:MAG TPA: DUF5103 domain-containing protein [Chitinophagaceae bacterium]|nr:DUF5103 domain-containing protein [Chitinophagaceae bacterium]
MKRLPVIIAVLLAATSFAQIPDHIYKSAIHSVQLYKSGDMTAYPVIKLNSNDQLELHFDDLDADVKMYYYSFELRNADWSPTMLYPFDYIRGFQDVRITNYRQSSIAFTRYTHYQAAVPDRNCVPTRSGNYLLKVFLNGDTSQLVFTRRLLVVDPKTSLAAQVQQPFSAQRFRTHQKLQIILQTNSNVNNFSPQDLKVVAMQNTIWQTAVYLDRPTINRGNYYEYNDENLLSFPAGKEWRWIDLRSLRLMSDRMVHIDQGRDRTDVFVKPDAERRMETYIYYRDLNGHFTIETYESVNPFWQGDYAYVHFSYFPPGNRPYSGKNIYLFGQLTNYEFDDAAKMDFDESKGAYEKTLFLKQGYYNYSYVTVPENQPAAGAFSYENTEGNYENTENTYTVLVYYRPFGARADELIGYTSVSSIFQRP